MKNEEMSDKELFEFLKELFNAPDEWVKGWLSNGDPRTNIAQAFEVVGKLLKENYGFELHCDFGKLWFAEFESYEPPDDWEGIADTPALAICLAAKKALEDK